MAPRTTGPSGFAALPGGAKAGLLVMMLLLLSAIYYFALQMSLSDDIDSARQQYDNLLQEEEEARERQQEYLQLTQELAQREAVDRQNKRVLPEDAEIAAFLGDLNRLAEVSGLEMRLVEPRPEEAQALYVRIPVTLSLNGRYHQVAKFFFNVSRLERAINMENIQLKEPEMEGDEVRLAVDVLATTFRRPTEAESTAAMVDAQGAQPQ